MKNIIIPIFLFMLFQSCVDCNSYTKIISEDECNLVVEIPPSEYPNLFKTKGYDPVTKEKKFATMKIDGGTSIKKRLEKEILLLKRKES